MLLTRNVKTVLLWALLRAYKTKGVFTVNWKEVCEETGIHRNTLAGIFKRLSVLDAFIINEIEGSGDSQKFTVNMSDYKEFTTLIVPIFDVVLGMRAKRKKIRRTILNKSTVMDNRPLQIITNEDSTSVKQLNAPKHNLVDTSLRSVSIVSGTKSPDAGSGKKKRTKVPDARQLVFENSVSSLNKLASRQYKHSLINRKFVFSLLKQGYTAEDIMLVIVDKTNEWKGTRFDEYLRPKTLFGDNFESYLHTAKNRKQSSQGGTRNLSL